MTIGDGIFGASIVLAIVAWNIFRHSFFYREEDDEKEGDPPP